MDSLKSSFFGRLFTDNRITAETAGLVTQPSITPSVTAVGPITVFVPMATTNQPTPGLLKCPNEVLANIFSNPGLSKNDIKALRLVCTQLRPLATRVFAQRYFTDPFVILSRYALEALVEICEDPIFSPHVQSIGFLTTTLHPDDSTKKALEELNAFTQFSAEQVHLESSGEAERLLARAISALGRPMVVTVTNDIDSISPIGVSKVPSNRYYNRFETLREIELSGVTLLGSWKECISWMMENLHLETFRIKDACSITHGRKTNHGRFIPADCLVAPTDLVGKEDTRVGLEKLLKHKFEK
ncbi:hypothetical protein D6C83_05470 [Aureobasidium pullulans]|uniref:F-box domain-containing protein n=1 Tax=Aureobasidium pullulans TaxID=5580 RepID=A0A4T0CE92_AURPU|nr:hypothetical protein D6C83_05470 [Aureobasidium pullulans]